MACWKEQTPLERKITWHRMVETAGAIQPRSWRRRYCSNACRQEAHRARHRFGEGLTGAQRAARIGGLAEELRGRAAAIQALAAGMRVTLLNRVIWPHAHHPGAGPGGYTTAAAELLAAAEQTLAAVVATDRAAGLSWEQIGAQLGVDASTARPRHAPADHATPPAAAATRDATEDPGDDKDVLQDVPQVGREWDDTDVCLVRDEGRWSLYGPDGQIEVDGFGMFGWIRARDTTGAQAAAAEAVTALTGRAVTGWDRDAYSRSVYGESTWYACLADP